MKTCVSPVLLFLCCSFLSCDSTEPPQPPPEPVQTITLSVEDVGVTEAWLRVSIPDTVQRRAFAFTRDGLPIDSSSIAGNDTVLMDSNLLPNHTYVYRAYRLDTAAPADSTEQIPVLTLDTTSHEFAWETFEFGDHSSSVLLDVAIINENDIWAVGEIFLNDSTGQPDIDSYNAVHWDGQEWAILRVPVQICGTQAVGSPTLYSVFGFSSNTVHFTEGGNLVTWDGAGYTQMCLPDGLILGTLREIWSSSLGGLYVCGGGGTIVHYNGSIWERIESGTSVDINDVWGARDVVTGSMTIISPATNFNGFGERLLLQIQADGSVSRLSWSPQRSLHSAWFSSPDRMFVGGAAVFVGNPNSWSEIPVVSTYFSRSIRGSSRSNVFVAGDFGLVGHFNGMTWKTYSEVFLGDGTYESVAVTDGLVIAVGQTGSRAAILRGVQ